MSDRLRELRALCTEKQARLAEAFLENGGNGTEAARAAGYKGGDAALRVTATRTLANANVLAYVEALRDARPRRRRTSS